MILDTINPAQVVLQAVMQQPDGQPKYDIASASVRVYHVVAGIEVVDLPVTPLAQVGASNTWRYVWAPGALPKGVYVAEYQAADDAGAFFVGVEEIIIQDLAKQADLAVVKADVATLVVDVTAVKADLAVVRQVETGRWRIVANQMLFYAADDVTPLLVFDLKDDAGLPSMDRVFERVPA